MHLLLLAVLTQVPDTSAPFDADRIVIDAAAIVREGGVQSLADVLNSRVPGLLVVSGSGLNGGGSRIRFAGPRRLLSDGMPLILVDGIRVDAIADASQIGLGGPGPLRLEDFNLEDIESIEVERSPAGGMLYGPGAADGVILIRTKRGRAGRIQAGGYAQGAFESVPDRWPANYGGVDADNPTSYYREGACSLTEQAAGRCQQDFVQSFNPLAQRSPFTTAVRHHAGFNATGGPAWGGFRVAGGIDGDGGVYDVPIVANPDSYDRWNVTGGGTVRPIAAIDLGFTVTHHSSNIALPLYGPVRTALLGPSDSTGFDWAPMFATSARERVSRSTGVVEANVRLLRWLTAHGLLGLDKVHQGDTALIPGSQRIYGTRRIKQTTSALTVTASANAAGTLRFVTTLGLQRTDRRRREDQRAGPDTDPFCSPACAAGSLNMLNRTNGAFLSERISVRERFVVTAALREDHFSTYRQRQTNPSLGISLVARREGSGVLGGLRLRAAYGSASEDGSADFVQLVFVPVGTTLPRLEPDRVKSFEAGADAKFFNERWGGQVTVYDLRSDTKRAVAVPSAYGLVYTYASGTKIGNRGIVATLSGALLDRDDVRWDIQLWAWGNRNRLISSLAPQEILNGYQGLLTGYPTGGYWGQQITGYADANQDGIIDASEVSVASVPVWAGTPYPTQGAGLHSSLKLGRSLRFSTTLDYRAGHVLYNESAWARCRISTVVCRERVDPRTPLGQQAVAVAPSYSIPLEYFEDADFLKLRELQVSVDVPPHVAGILRAHAATVSLAARNLFTVTRYSGGDPEAGSYGSMTPGPLLTVADFGTIPVARTWSLRVNVSY